jgi:hypothetical protein
MRRCMLWALALGLAASASALTPSTSNVFQPEQKPWNEISRQDGVRVTGDTVGDPFIVGALPFTATGNTCSFINDYDYACPYSGSTSADVVYKWIATVGGTGSAPTGAITVDLCASTYDTKVYIYDGSMAVIACNDDYCSFQSQVSNVPVTAGNAYYIVIDGYGGSCGTYNMTVSEYQPCVLSCRPGAILEGEPTCYDGYNDVYNGGCNSVPFPVFQIIEPLDDDITICGTTGVFPMDTTTYRDTDWYQLDISWYGYICLSGDAEVPSYFFIIDGRGGCSTSAVVAYGLAGPCAPVSDICYSCDPGTWWAWAGPRSWDLSFACGSLYNLTISHYGWSPVEPTTWGRVKGMFR